MKVTFRQGIARYQTDVNANPTFLQKSTLNSQFIDLIVSPDPTIIVFAHKAANYVFEEVKTVRNAWGPFSGSTTHYLYWDVDLLTGQLTRGSTVLPPLVAGVAPPSAAVDQHWFDTQSTVMKVWNGSKWVEKVRCFAATYSSSAIVKAPPGFPSSANSWLGSQVGLAGDFDVGNIVLDSFFKPIRQSDGSFVTSTTNMSVVSIGTRRVRFEADLVSLLANEFIPKFSLVQVRAGRRAVLARSTDKFSRVIGLSIEDMHLGETSTIVTGGLVRNDQWNWSPTSVGRPIFLGATGEITLVPAISGVHQQVGQVYDTDAVQVDIHPAIMLDNPYDDDTVVPPPVEPFLPTADFSVISSQRSGPAPHTVDFVNSSTGSPTSFEWDFTNDGVVESNAASPTYTFIAPGVYDVRLRAINGFGADDETKVGYITVTAPPSTGTFTNLEMNLGAPMRVNRGQLFPVSVTIRNDGLLTATSVQRIITLPDVDGPGNSWHQVVPSGLPVGTTTARVGRSTVVTLPTITSLGSGGVSTVAFSLTAPSVSGQIRVTGVVTSPEADSEAGDNTSSLFIEVRS